MNTEIIKAHITKWFGEQIVEDTIINTLLPMLLDFHNTYYGDTLEDDVVTTSPTIKIVAVDKQGVKHQILEVTNIVPLVNGFIFNYPNGSIGAVWTNNHIRWFEVNEPPVEPTHVVMEYNDESPEGGIDVFRGTERTCKAYVGERLYGGSSYVIKPLVEQEDNSKLEEPTEEVPYSDISAEQVYTDMINEEPVDEPVEYDEASKYDMYIDPFTGKLIPVKPDDSVKYTVDLLDDDMNTIDKDVFQGSLVACKVFVQGNKHYLYHPK